jgi:hypothetical protein
MVKNRIVVQLAFCGLILGAQAMMAGTITTGLADWCVNLNGDINTACNGAGAGGASGNGNIDLSAFDSTLEPGTNTLGTVTIALGVGNNQFADFYADYDLDFATTGAFQDLATTSGTLPAGTSYEADDPNVSNIFSDFASNTLSNVNNVGNFSGPPAPCCDVSFALGLSGINVAAGGTVSVVFNITDVAPTSGFYITQTNGQAGDSIYLQGIVTVTNPITGGSTPEPSTFVLGLMAAGTILYAGKRRRASLPVR